VACSWSLTKANFEVRSIATNEISAKDLTFIKGGDKKER